MKWSRWYTHDEDRVPDLGDYVQVKASQDEWSEEELRMFQGVVTKSNPAECTFSIAPDADLRDWYYQGWRKRIIGDELSETRNEALELEDA